MLWGSQIKIWNLANHMKNTKQKTSKCKIYWWKTENKESDILCFSFFMWFVRFGILICEPQSICWKFLVLSWLYHLLFRCIVLRIVIWHFFWKIRAKEKNFLRLSYLYLVPFFLRGVLISYEWLILFLTENFYHKIGICEIYFSDGRNQCDSSNSFDE